MKLYENALLSAYTTLKVGGPARRLLIPENKDELIEAIIGIRSSGLPYAVIGKGSNILAEDNGFDGIIIVNTSACQELRFNHLILAGSSVRLHQLVQFSIEHRKGGLEYLYSIPGTVGGAIYMNAGRGKNHQANISDFLIWVDIFDGFQERRLSKNECDFGHRTSIFHRQPYWTILSAAFDLPSQPQAIGEQKIYERTQLAKQSHDLRYPNAGSVFKSGFHNLKELKGYRIGGARFSRKTENWISNMGTASSNDIKKLISYARQCHLKHGLIPPSLEWIELKKYIPSPSFSRRIRECLRPYFQRRQFITRF